MEQKDVFSFEDFLSRKSSVVKSDNQELESVKETVKQEEVVEPVKEAVQEVEPIKEITKPVQQIVEEVIEEEVIEEEVYTETVQEDDSFYKLYKDKNEEFSCDIAIEGSDPEDTFARIIVESEDWSLVFPGTIRNGKCIVPIKKLNILKEGEVGNIKLEVVAEGNLFTPWEDKFKVKLSKKVTVNVNEQKSTPKKPVNNRGVGVKVNVNK